MVSWYPPLPSEIQNPRPLSELLAEPSPLLLGIPETAYAYTSADKSAAMSNRISSALTPTETTRSRSVTF